MSSGTFIIESALKRIGAASVVQPAAPETIVEGRDVLKSMLQLWKTQGIELGFVPLDAPGDELGEPLDARNAIIDNLALMLAPDFDNGRGNVSEQLKNNARNGYAWIKQTYRKLEVPKKGVSSTTPRGIGNINGVNSRIFFDERTIVSAHIPSGIDIQVPDGIDLTEFSNLFDFKMKFLILSLKSDD